MAEAANVKAAKATDVLFGMKAICDYLGRSDATVLKFCREYDDFPVRKENGSGYISSRSRLDEWFKAFLSK